nr:hypothetical protein [Escherichia coli]
MFNLFIKPTVTFFMTGNGINTVRINNEVKHISELDPEISFFLEWNKLKK